MKMKRKKNILLFVITIVSILIAIYIFTVVGDSNANAAENNYNSALVLHNSELTDKKHLIIMG